MGKGDTAATQDLLTGGMGRTGLGAAAAPAYADPANPTAAELRRNALYSNYRGILDPSAGGGYGLLYGPNVTADGQVTSNEGLIPGREYVAVLDDGTGRKQTVIAVQVPDSFSASNPCIVLGASSGSRGVYGAIGTAGEWGLKKGCAVALSAPGKWSYVYGRLSPENAAEILSGAALYAASADGLVPWRDRPEIFRKPSLARIPPQE